MSTQTVPSPELFFETATAFQRTAALKAAVEEALLGRGSLVLVVGEPGMGKTRLVEEAAVYARLRSAQVLIGHCYETGSSLPYLPFVEILESGLAQAAISGRWPPTARIRAGTVGRMTSVVCLRVFGSAGTGRRTRAPVQRRGEGGGPLARLALTPRPGSSIVW